MNKKWFSLAAVTLFAVSIATAQSAQNAVVAPSKKELPAEIKKDWFNLSYDEAKVYGTGTNITYKELIQDKQPKKKIVVAVIDSGVDWEHEDLKNHIWVNKGEIPNNGLDDDKNGFVDDVHGWNFLVADDGSDISGETLEATRILRLSKELKEAGDEDAYPDWLTNEMILDAIDIYNKNVDDIKGFENFALAFSYVDSTMQAEYGEDYTMETAQTIPDGKSEDLDKAKLLLVSMSSAKVGLGDLRDLSNHVMDMTQYHLNMELVTRASLTPEDEFYGNNHYEGIGGDATHGTHVAGIIAADRTNDFGSRGIASEVADIMILRAVPNGDEHDVDIANAIKYAVNNGAHIINMSFGKGISPHYQLVSDALKYADEKGVLVVHAAGNDHANNDTTANYPNVKSIENAEALSYLTVGAIAPQKNKKLLAPFTNYGVQSIDIFAPGFDIYATTPDNEYQFLSGTSMAAPTVSGVAALIWAYHPELNARDLKQVILDSSIKLPKKKVVLPGTKREKVRLGEISKNPGIISTYEAFSQLGGL